MAHPQTPELSNENPGYYSEDQTIPTTDPDFFLFDQTRDASPHTVEEFISEETGRGDASIQNKEGDFNFLEKFSTEQNNSADKSETSEENRKRKISREDISHGTDAYKQSRPEVYGMSDEVVPNFSDNGFINPDSRKNEITMSSQIMFDSGISACINSELLNYEESQIHTHKIPKRDSHCPMTGNEGLGHYAEDANTPMNDCVFYILEQTPVTSTQTTLSYSNLLEQFLSNYSDNDFINPASRTNDITTSSHTAFYYGSLPCINSEILDYENSNPKNQALKAFDYLGKEENLSTGRCTAYNKKIFQKVDEACGITDAYVDKVENVGSGDDILPVPGTSCCLENYSPSKLYVEKVPNGSLLKQQPPVEMEQKQSNCLSCKKTISGHVEVHEGKDMYRCCICPSIHESIDYLHMHVFVQHTWLKEVAECEITNADISKSENVCSVDDRLAVPGKSGCRENNFNSKLCVEKVQNGSQLKKQPPIKTEQILLPCLYCKKTVSNHLVIHDGKDKYRCCGCFILYENFNYMQMHVYNEHTKPFYCYECQMKYSEVGTHARDQMCDVCNQKFECKYQLEEHYILVHKDFLETHCRICKKRFDKHFMKAVKEYQCCECKYQNVYPCQFSEHTYTHSVLKIFKCEICGNHFKRFKYLRAHLKNDHPVCKFCEKRFVNIFFLNVHLCEEHRVEFS